jgi:glycosyltransferase involved in cell wall biosynthesis
LKAFSSIQSASQSAALWIVGPDEEGVMIQVQEEFPEICGVVKWIGPTFSPENYMAGADVLLLPSYREGFGSVIIEAAACNLPTIAYRIDGVIDAVVDNQTGLLVEKGNTEVLEQQMENLLLNPSLRSRLGASAGERARRDFSSNIVTSAWLEFYASILK